MIRYFLSRPLFPVICDLDNMLIAAKSHRKLDAELVVSPLTLKHRWTKKEIVRMFNDSTNARLSNMRYPERSLGNKRLDRIVAEIVEVILIAEKRIRPATRRGPTKT